MKTQRYRKQKQKSTNNQVALSMQKQMGGKRKFIFTRSATYDVHTIYETECKN